MKRGQAEIIGGLIILSVIVVVLIPFLLSFMSSQGEAISKQADVGTYYIEKMREKVEVSWDLSTLLPNSRVRAFWINNTGSVIVSIKYLKLINERTGEVLFVNLSNYEPSPEKPVKRILKYPPGTPVSRAIITLSPGEAAYIEIDTFLVPDLVFTHRANPHTGSGAGTGRGLFEYRVYPLHKITNITLFTLRHQSYFNNHHPEAGVVTYDYWGMVYYYYRLVHERKNVHLRGERYHFDVAVIGQVPGTNEFNMLFVGQLGRSHVRIKVEGFVPERGFFFQYASAAWGYDGRIERRANENDLIHAVGRYFWANPRQSYVVLVGKAKSIKVFELAYSRAPWMSSYDPFILYADTDGNGKGEVIFVGEDVFGCWEDWGHGCPSAYDQVLQTCVLDERFYDYSAIRRFGRIELDREWGFAFLLRQEPLHSSRHVGALVAVRLYFHDIEPGDLSCVDATGLPILRVMLVTQDWRVVDSRSIYYWELAHIEDTWPPHRDFATYHFSLFVPPGFPEPVYVAIAIVDPFPGLRRNDVDFTIAVELVSLIIINR